MRYKRATARERREWDANRFPPTKLQGFLYRNGCVTRQYKTGRHTVTGNVYRRTRAQKLRKLFNCLISRGVLA